MNNRKRGAALLSAAMMLATAFNPSALMAVIAEDINYGPIYVVPNTLEVEKSDTSFMAQYPAGQTLKFSAARNERESGQIIIHSDQNIGKITVDTASLYNGKAEIPKANIEVFFEQYVEIKSTDDQCSRLQKVNGFHADPLLPYDMAIDEDMVIDKDMAIDENVNLNKLDTTNGGNQGIWFTVTVPDDAKAGTYSGEFTVTLDGKACQVPVEFTVYDFDLPTQTQSKTRFNSVHRLDMEYQIDYVGYDDKTMSKDEMNQQYQEDVNAMMNSHKISTGWAGADALTINNRVPPDGDLKSDEEYQAGLDAYTETVYNYVKGSQVPYYNLEPQSISCDTGADINAAQCFSVEDFNIDFEGIYKEVQQKSENDQTIDLETEYQKRIRDAIDSNYQAIEDIIKNDLNGGSLSTESLKNLEKAVKLYLYYDVYYRLHMLSEGFNGIEEADEANPSYEKKLFDLELGILNTDPNVSTAGDYKNVEVKYDDLAKRIEYLRSNDPIPADPESFVKRLYDCIMYTGDMKLVELVRLWYNAYRISQYDFFSETESSSTPGKKYRTDVYGLETVMRALVDKSFATDTDLLHYAYVRPHKIDEPTPYNFWAAYDNLAAAKVLENSIEGTLAYIDQEYADKHSLLKSQIIESIKNLCMIHTASPASSLTYDRWDGHMRIDVPMYTGILYNGLQQLDVMQKNGVISNVGDYTMDFYSIDQYEIKQDQYGKTVGYSRNKETKPYTLHFEKDDVAHTFCPIFNDYSAADVTGSQHEGFAKDYEATIDALKDPDTHMWWYSCMSQYNSALPGYHIAGNVNNDNTPINGNSLAILRANKWQQFALGIEGEYYWSVDEQEPNEDSWTNTIDDHMLNEGLLIYPFYALLSNTLGKSEESQALMEKFGKKLASSIRLENLSEATDDYDYLCIAEQGVMRHPEYRDYLNSIIGYLIEVGNVDYTNTNFTNSEHLAKARNELAMLIVKCNSLDKQKVTKDNKQTYAVSAVEKWNTSGKMLCFDISEENADVTSENHTVSITLANQSGDALGQSLTLDFVSDTVTGCEHAQMVSLKNGWYTVQIPLSQVVPTDDSAAADTLTKITASSADGTFCVSNCQVYQEVTSVSTVNFALPKTENWYTSGKILCFDVCEEAASQSSEDRTVGVYLVSNQGERMNHRIYIDFATHSILDCEGATMMVKANNWYTVQIPLASLRLYDNYDGTETLTTLCFGKDNNKTPIVVDNVRLHQEITDEKTVYFDCPKVEKWYESGKMLCFDVYETPFEYSFGKERTASIYLDSDKGERMNHRIYMDFATKSITGCEGAFMIPKGNGWYTVQIPFRVLSLYDGYNGLETLAELCFSHEQRTAQFMVDADSIGVYYENTNEYTARYANTIEFDTPITNWHESEKILAFNVRETNSYHNADGSRTVSVYLKTSGKDQNNVNHRIYIDFATKTIQKCTTAEMSYQGDGWYTVQIPLKDLNLYDSFSGEEQLVGIHFSDDDLNASFLVDTFNVIEKRGSSGLKSGSISYHAAPPSTEAPSEDINDDGRVSIADAVMLSRYVGEDSTVKMPEAGKSRVDCNDDGIVDMSDVVKILRVIARLD